MRQLFFSLRLFIFGAFCDFCASRLTTQAEKCIMENKPLNKKLLTAMSNFSANNFVKWQCIEQSFLDEFGYDPNIP